MKTLSFLRDILAALWLVTSAPTSPAAAQDSAFHLATDDPGRSPSPYVGNGHLGVVVPALGIGATHSFKAGLYEHAPSDVPRIVTVPAWNGIDVHDGESWLGERPISESVGAYRQVLDLRTGTVRTSYHRRTRAGPMSVRVETFVSRARPDLAAIRLNLAPQYSARLRIRFVLAGWPPPQRLALATLEKAQPGWRPGDIWYPGHMVVRSRHARRSASGAQISLTSTPVGRNTILAQVASVSWPRALPNPAIATMTRGDTAMVELAFDASGGRNYNFVQVVSFASGETAGSLSAAAQQASAAQAKGFDQLARENASAWRKLWKTDIEIEGDPALQRVVRSMLFYLLASAAPGTELGIPPMGLSSAGYYGHIFWDSDTWMFPTLLVTHPEIAHSLVAFRRHTLPAAQANARANGFRGAMYPWEADELGQETTPHFAVQNARSEIHVNGDVALAQWQYYLATGDLDWLARTGLPVIRGTADFWVSRVTHDSAGDRYHIHDVVSVSEGLIGVSDDAYTNAVARKNLEIATMASKRLGREPDPRWLEIAGKLHLPYDSASGFYRTYEGAHDSTLGDVTPLLAYPLGVPMSERAKRSQLEQAVKRLLTQGPGAMMGSTLLAVDAAELGDRALVDSLLPHSYQRWLQGPFLMLSETPEKKDAVNFVTGAGGFLQQVLFGWTGLRLGQRGLEPAFAPVLPSRIKRLVLRNVYSRGRRFDVVIDSAGRRITPRGGSGR